ncbi:MAG: hypothetical protein DI539_30580 [Flavobacterium psychrophilum]|nr:MAG: hypothetical protein DI539_30580 [Flavobacterium psychrophilum]
MIYKETSLLLIQIQLNKRNTKIGFGVTTTSGDNFRKQSAWRCVGRNIVPLHFRVGCGGFRLR